MGDVEAADGGVAVTQRLELGSSTGRERLREPSEHHAAPADVIGQTMDPAVTALELEAWGEVSDRELAALSSRGQRKRDCHESRAKLESLGHRERGYQEFHPFNTSRTVVLRDEIVKGFFRNFSPFSPATRRVTSSSLCPLMKTTGRSLRMARRP